MNRVKKLLLQLTTLYFLPWSSKTIMPSTRLPFVLFFCSIITAAAIGINDYKSESAKTTALRATLGPTGDAHLELRRAFQALVERELRDNKARFYCLVSAFSRSLLNNWTKPACLVALCLLAISG